MDAEELLRRYAGGERDFAGIRFSSQALREVNLSGINLRGDRISQSCITVLFCSPDFGSMPRNANMCQNSDWKAI